MRRRAFLGVTAGAVLAAGCRGAPSSPHGDDLPVPPRVTGVPQVLVFEGGQTPSFASYLAEMLSAEGVVGLGGPIPFGGPEALPADLPALACSGPVPAAWVPLLESFVERGGCVVALCPGPELLARLGIGETGAMSKASGVVFEPRDDDRPLRLHVEARAWTSRAGVVDASFVGPDGPASPAVIRIARGAGVFVAWAFDVARNVALIRQGNPAWEGQERDGWPGVRLVDAMAGWVDANALARPDADIYQRAVALPLVTGSPAAGPVVRTDYFPDEADAVLVATADAHGVGTDVLDALLQRVERAGGRVSVYYAPPDTAGWRVHARRLRWALSEGLGAPSLVSGAAPPSPAHVAAWRARGHEFAPHPDGEAGLEPGLDAAWKRFADDGYGSAHVSTRTHKVLWSGWVATPKAQRARGVRMNLDAYHAGPILKRSDGTWAAGHVIGSGLPLRFVDESGQLVDCYQQPTQIVDEHLLGAFGGNAGLSGREAAGVAARQVEQAVSGAPAALCGQFHADGFAVEPARVAEAAALLDGVLEACRRARVPVWTAARWLAFLDARRDTRLLARRWDPAARRLAVDLVVGAAPSGEVTLLVPAELAGVGVGTVLVDGRPTAAGTCRRGNRVWVRCAVRAGRRSVEIRYS